MMQQLTCISYSLDQRKGLQHTQKAFTQVDPHADILHWLGRGSLSHHRYRFLHPRL